MQIADLLTLVRADGHRGHNPIFLSRHQYDVQYIPDRSLAGAVDMLDKLFL